MIKRYPTLWPVFLFLALLALATRPRPVLFCCCIFIPSFAVLSLTPTKHFIYIYFVIPFLFVVWAVAVARLCYVVWRWIVTMTDHAVARVAPGLPQPATRWALIAASLLFMMVSNGAPARTILKPFGIALQSDETSIDWAPARAALQPWLERAAIVLTPNDMHALYYLGDYDVAVNPSRLLSHRRARGGRHEFSPTLDRQRSPGRGDQAGNEPGRTPRIPRPFCVSLAQIPAGRRHPSAHR